jgi:hypothetical protein
MLPLGVVLLTAASRLLVFVVGSLGRCRVKRFGILKKHMFMLCMVDDSSF